MMNSNIKEDLLYYIWKTKNFYWQELTTLSGKRVNIVNYGYQNLDAGPDFSNCTVEIDGIKWVGNVEMHVFSSDWDKHSHDTDPAYDNVILHVVYEYDREIIDTNSRVIETIELKDRIDTNLLSKYLQIIQSGSWIPCANLIHLVDDFFVKTWLDKLIIDRLERKVGEINSILEESNNDWEETLYRILSRYMGGKVNGIPFEMLARSLPINILKKNADRPLVLDALLYGQSGMLQAQHDDPYFITLQKEYHFYQKKYALKPINPLSWKFFRMRPINFPTIRIAQLSALLFKHKQFFSSVVSDSLSDFFQVEINEYWNTHYTFGKSSSFKNKTIGDGFRDTLIINVIAPVLFAYGNYTDNQDLKNKAIILLQSVKPEQNTVIKQWQDLGISPENAADTQALLRLKSRYCDNHQCLSCTIGHKLIC